MKRRQFLKNSIPAGVLLPGLFSGYSIKAFAEDSAIDTATNVAYHYYRSCIGINTINRW